MPSLSASANPGPTRLHWGLGPLHMFKTEVINQIAPWKSRREVEWETLEGVDWYNNRRLLGPFGYIPPAQAEEAFCANRTSRVFVPLQVDV